MGSILMPCFYLTHNNSQLFLNVGIIDASSVKIPSTPGASLGIPSPAMFKALVDTGAQKTMISPNVVKRLSLKQIGKILVQGIHATPQHHNSYLFHVALTMSLLPPGSPPPAPGGQITVLAFTLPKPIHGAELGFANAGFDVLLGMDVISTGSLIIQGNGTYSLSI